MPILNKDNILKEILSGTTSIILDDSSINDDDIKSFLESIPKNAKLSEIRIKAHCLTYNSYPDFLRFLNSHKNMTNFFLHTMILPMGPNDPYYNKAIREILARNLREKNEDSLQQINHNVEVSSQNAVEKFSSNANIHISESTDSSNVSSRSSNSGSTADEGSKETFINEELKKRLEGLSSEFTPPSPSTLQNISDTNHKLLEFSSSLKPLKTPLTSNLDPNLQNPNLSSVQKKGEINQI